MTKTKWQMIVLIASVLAVIIVNRAGLQPTHHAQATQSGHAHPSGIISVDVKYVDDTVHLLLGKTESGQQDVWYQSSADQGETWSVPVNITQSVEVSAKFSRGNDARLAIQGDALVAVWMTKVEGNRFNAGPMTAMRSEDHGQTWHPAAMPADWQGAHGFFAMDGNDQAINLVWLDSREPSHEGSQGLRFSQSRDGGLSWTANITLDEVTCACCWNTASFDNEGLFYVLYRDKHPSDMAIGRVDQHSKWQRLSSVGQFGWDFKGCPHIGGGLAFEQQPQRLHATVSTGQDNKVGLYYLNSDDKGRRWSAPVRLGDNTAVHSDIAVASTGKVVATWDRLTENGLQIVYASSDDHGQSWSSPHPLSTDKVSASHPRIIAMKNQFLVLWTTTDQHNHTDMQTISVPYHD